MIALYVRDRQQIGGAVCSALALSDAPDDFLRKPGAAAPAPRLPGALDRAAVVSQISLICLGFAVLGILCLMMPAGHHGGGRRDPPSYNPADEQRYSFVQWTQDVLVWSIAQQDLAPSVQCAQIISRLQGPARDLTRGMTFQEITHGGAINGRMMDLVSYLLTQLAPVSLPWGKKPASQLCKS